MYSGVIRDILHRCDHVFFTFYKPLSRFTRKSNIIYTQKKRRSTAFPVKIFTTHKCSTALRGDPVILNFNPTS
jgi:hypothetical protein